MKYAIDCGHNCPPDSGAVGIKREDELTLAVGNQVITQLQNLGHQVVNCTPTSAKSVSDSLAKRCQKTNDSRVDVFVSIHFNAFNGKAYGSEVFAISDKGKALAKSVLNEICSLGFFSRGVKDGSRLFVVRNTNAPAILVECCFVDSSKDMQLFDVGTMASAIVKGLTGVSPVQASGDKWVEFIDVLKATDIKYPQLKAAQLAQAILECGRGKSELFLLHNNPYGLKWRKEMSACATSVRYTAHDGLDDYCKFESLQDAVEGYWVFIGRSPYAGWERYANSPSDYLKFIVDAGYCPDKGYVDKVIKLLPEAIALLA